MEMIKTIGKVIYKDGTTEPILTCVRSLGYVEVTTPSGKYLYDEFIYEHENGIKHQSYDFYYYDMNSYQWLADMSIKEFQINKEV